MARETQQRRAIRRAFRENPRPLSPREVQKLAVAYTPGLGIATVYRTINRLVDDGWLRSVDLPGEASRYELQELPHHHHFHCRECDRVFDFHGCPTEVEDFAPAGFAVEHHEIILYGLCSTCAAEPA